MIFSMALTLHPEERDVIEAVLWFANLRRITSTHQIEVRLSGLSYVKGYFMVIEPHEVDAYRHDQAELREWLEDIISSEAGRNRVKKKVSERMNNVSEAKLLFENGSFGYRFVLHGVQAVCALGLALILDKKRGLSNRLKRCGNPDCLRFNLDFEPKGRPRRFCNDSCKRAFDNVDAVERVRRHRGKIKKLKRD